MELESDFIFQDKCFFSPQGKSSFLTWKWTFQHASIEFHPHIFLLFKCSHSQAHHDREKPLWSPNAWGTHKLGTQGRGSEVQTKRNRPRCGDCWGLHRTLNIPRDVTEIYITRGYSQLRSRFGKQEGTFASSRRSEITKLGFCSQFSSCLKWGKANLHMIGH